MNKTLLPKLRFPEYQDSPEWELKLLGEIMPITSSKRVHQSEWAKEGVTFYRAREIVALHNGLPISPLFISEELYKTNSNLSGEIKAGELLVTGVGSIGVPYLVKVGDRFYFKDGNIIWLQNNEQEITGMFLYLLYVSDFVQKQIKTMAGVGTVGTYTIDNAKKTLAVFPKNQAEQQKIADCLTSLDDLIAAQSQKVAALQTYKKGLMQNLFPAEGESVPRLRFPEFESAGEWEVRQLGEICHSFLNGGTPSTQKPEFWQGEIPWITGADVVNQKITSVRRFITEEAVKNSSTNIIEKGNLLIVTRTGVGKMAIAPFDLAISQDLTGVYVDTEQSTPEYLYEFLNSNSEKIKSMNQGTSIAGITRESLIEMKVPLPSIPEQQRIAELLSALDEEISAQGEAVAGLKVHKRGLMQGLFPRNEETSEVLKTSEV